MNSRGTVMQLHNETGFHNKPINVAKAVLYSLMPAGSVLKVPDSLDYQVKYLAEQATDPDAIDQRPDVRVVPQELKQSWWALIKGMVADLSPQEREEMMYYFTVGSTNMDYRSMSLDGEVMVVVGGWQSLFGFMDFLLLPGLCEWVETTEQLDALLPPPSGFTRALAGLMKLTL